MESGPPSGKRIEKKNIFHRVLALGCRNGEDGGHVSSESSSSDPMGNKYGAEIIERENLNGAWSGNSCESSGCVGCVIIPLPDA